MGILNELMDAIAGEEDDSVDPAQFNQKHRLILAAIAMHGMSCNPWKERDPYTMAETAVARADALLEMFHEEAEGK